VIFTIIAGLLGFVFVFLFLPSSHLPSKKPLKSLFTSNASPSDSSDDVQSPLVYLFTIVLVLFTVSTELIIKWNQISGVNSIQSTGQILPLIVGVGSLIRIIWKYFCPSPDEE
jgi:hypothetical protein